jgi:hypothetical protein
MTKAEIETFIKNIEFAKAFLEDKPMQVRHRNNSGPFVDLNHDDPGFHLPGWEWRLKPEPFEMLVATSKEPRTWIATTTKRSEDERREFINAWKSHGCRVLLLTESEEL